jgi:hypothetical protein
VGGADSSMISNSRSVACRDRWPGRPFSTHGQSPAVRVALQAATLSRAILGTPVHSVKRQCGDRKSSRASIIESLLSLKDHELRVEQQLLLD